MENYYPTQQFKYSYDDNLGPQAKQV